MDDSKRKNVIEKIKKALALTASSNEAEAAAAADMATRLMHQYQLEISDLGDLEQTTVGERPIGQSYWKPLRGVLRTGWTTTLAQAVARANFCDILFGTTGITFVGREDNVEIATYVMTNLHTQMLLMVVSRVKEHTKECKRRGISVLGGEHDHQVYRRSWLEGCANAIANALYGQMATFKGTLKGNEIVTQEQALVKQYISETWPHLGTFRVRHSIGNSEGYAKGKADGASMNAQPGIHSNAVSTKRLGAG